MKSTLVKTRLVQQQIGWRKARPGEDGPQPIWLQQGGSEDAGDGTGGDPGGEGEDDSAGGDGEDDEDKGTGSEQPKMVSQAEFDRIKKHLSEADRKKNEALQRLRELETKDLPEAEKLKIDHEEAVKDRDTFRERWSTLARTNAFLMKSAALKLNWVNAEAALKLGDLDTLEIEADGTVVGIEDALKKLAKDHPYLLAPTQSDEEDTRPPKTGAQVGNTKRGKKPESEFSEEELRRRFSAL